VTLKPLYTFKKINYNEIKKINVLQNYLKYGSRVTLCLTSARLAATKVDTIWRTESELGATPKQRWAEVKRLAVGWEDELHYAVTNHIRKQYPDATITEGIGEHLTKDHAKMDARLKGYVGGQPDAIVIRGLPNAFQDALAIELKSPNQIGRLSIKQQEYIDDLELNCKVQTIDGCECDDLILRIHDHYKDVFSRAQQTSKNSSPTSPPTKTQRIGSKTTNSLTCVRSAT
jgi:hypothetical protein